MLPDSLNTNEIKNASGVEMEFSLLNRHNQGAEFRYVSEAPALHHRLNIAHAESGSGFNRIRRSKVRFDLSVFSDLDLTKVVTCSAYANIVIPIGALASYDNAKLVLANLNSFLSTTGVGTTVLFDGTGHGSATLLNGSL